MKIGTDGVILGAWVPWLSGETPAEIWDVGTGTGLIALMLAQRFPDSHITAVEIDEEAAGEAALNFRQSPWDDRIDLVKGDINEVMDRLAVPDLIVSNPPFFNEAVHSPDPKRRDARHETSLTIESLIAGASQKLNEGGTLAFIAPYRRIDEIEYAAFTRKMMPTHLVPVISRYGNMPARILVNLIKGKLPRTVERGQLTIRDAANRYTESYIKLTNDFYTHLKQ